MAGFQQMGGIILPIQENLQFAIAGKRNFGGPRTGWNHLKQSQNRTNYKFFLVLHFNNFNLQQVIPASMSALLT